MRIEDMNRDEVEWYIQETKTAMRNIPLPQGDRLHSKLDLYLQDLIHHSSILDEKDEANNG